jgi:hypothetical protein
MQPLLIRVVYPVQLICEVLRDKSSPICIYNQVRSYRWTDGDDASKRVHAMTHPGTPWRRRRGSRAAGLARRRRSPPNRAHCIRTVLISAEERDRPPKNDMKQSHGTHTTASKPNDLRPDQEDKRLHSPWHVYLLNYGCVCVCAIHMCKYVQGMHPHR